MDNHIRSEVQTFTGYIDFMRKTRTANAVTPEYAVIGLSNEIFELLDALTKTGLLLSTQVDVLSESGDVLWYLFALMDSFSIPVNDVFATDLIIRLMTYKYTDAEAQHAIISDAQTITGISKKALRGDYAVQIADETGWKVTTSKEEGGPPRMSVYSYLRDQHGILHAVNSKVDCTDMRNAKRLALYEDHLTDVLRGQLTQYKTSQISLSVARIVRCIGSLANNRGKTLQDVFNINVSKLTERFLSGTIMGDGENRSKH